MNINLQMYIKSQKKDKLINISSISNLKYLTINYLVYDFLFYHDIVSHKVFFYIFLMITL
jgi:hypothetical protein